MCPIRGLWRTGRVSAALRHILSAVLAAGAFETVLSRISLVFPERADVSGSSCEL